MRFAPDRRWRTPVVASAWVALVLVALLVPSVGSATHPKPVAGPPPIAIGSSVAGTLLYNGRATANSTTPTTAMTVNFGSSVTLEYSWVGLGGKLGTPLAVPIQTARLQVLYLGLSIYTKDQTLSPPSISPTGSLNLTADFTFARYLIEGLYQLNGILIAPNGSTPWTESFYVKDTAPYHLTVSNIALFLIGAYEIFTILMVGRWVRGQYGKDRPLPKDEGKPEEFPAHSKSESGETSADATGGKT